MKRKKKTEAQKYRDLADSLLTQIIKAQHPQCESCGHTTQVGHHWIEKSRSSFLRYDLRNIIPLCHSCHSKIHNTFGNSVVGGLDVAEVIIKKRGRKWKQTLDREMNTLVKTDKFFYIENYERLSMYL